MVAALCHQLRLDQPWLACKLPLRATPTAVAVYPEIRLLAITTSRLAAPPRNFLPVEAGGDAVAAAAYATAEAAVKAAQVEDLNELQLLAPPGCGLTTETYHSVYRAVREAADAAGPAGGSTGSTGLLPSIGSGAATAAGSATSSNARVAAAVAAAAGWAGLPLWRYSLLPGEEAMALKHVLLCEGGDEKANPEPFIAVGCVSAFGEDYPALGRVLLFQVLKDRVFRLEGGSEVKVTARLVRAAASVRMETELQHVFALLRWPVRRSGQMGCDSSAGRGQLGGWFNVVSAQQTPVAFSPDNCVLIDSVVMHLNSRLVAV